MMGHTEERMLFRSIEYNKIHHPEQTAFLLRDGNQLRPVTHAAFFHQVAGCRAHFLPLGFHRVGILGSNSYEWICNAFGILAAEITVAMLDPLLPEEDLLSAIRRTDLDLLVIDEALPQLWDLIAKKMPQIALSHYWKEPEDSTIQENTENWKEGETIFFSSGTSQNSKAVVTPTSSIAGHAAAQKELAVYCEGDVVLHPLPYHHSYGFAMLCFYHHANCRIMISSMKNLLSDVRKIRPDRIVLVPSAVEFLLKKNALSYGTKSIMVSGSRFPNELAASVRSLGIIAQNQYGSSELPCGIGDNLPQDDVDVLTLHPFVKIQIADDGEILVTDPYHFREYYKDPEATAATLRDGTVHTGDMGYLDDQGRLHLIGRKKNMIVMENGEKVFCPDVDRELSALPGVKEAAVIYTGGRLIAVVAPEKGATEEGILQSIATYNSLQPYYRRMRDTWIYGEKLPYTSSGKLHRSKLEREYPEKDSDTNS